LESANASKIKSYEEEKEELESTVEKSRTELDCLMKELVAYEEVKGEHEQLIDRVSNLEDELQSSLERNDQLSTDIESLKILKEENKNDTERVSDVITDDDVLSLESDTINTENLIITGTRSISEGREDPGGTLEYSNFSPRKSPQNMDEDLGTVLSRASLSRSGTMNPTEDLKIGKSEDVSNNPIADGDIDSQNKLVEKYLYPLVDKAEAELDEAIPNDIVQGIYDALFLVLHVERESISVLGWEDFESILEEVCQEYDAETWFQIQEAFFAAWEQLDESNKSLLELSEVSESWCNFDTTTQ
jgi:hypothetical protein